MSESNKYEEVKEVLLEALRTGLPKSHACNLAGIGRQTLYDWINWGEAGKEGYVQIGQDIKKAQSEFVKGALAKIKEAGDNKQWPAYAWLLERMFKEDFARLEKVATTDPTGENEPGSVDQARRIVAEFISKESARRKLNGNGPKGSNGHAQLGAGPKK